MLMLIGPSRKICLGCKVQHLQLLSALQGGASALETAAAEMQQAASSLVAIERRIGELSEQGVSLHSETLLACAVLLCLT